MDATSVPRLAAGCRLHPTEEILLIPEGTLKLNGPSRDILTLLDGRRSLADIADHLAAQYEGADREAIQGDVIALLTRMQQRGVVKV